ncbi:MAG TPA: class IV adenylate cyclase [Methanocorpusculum sp.]|nr:class IV adenylate cyclase [Methanocorpusculum sp.]
MGLEIEIKVKVASLSAIRVKLTADGCAKIADQDEYDVYFNSPVRDFAVSDEALRLRYVKNQKAGKAMPPCITYKGPKVGREGFKAREELIVDLSSGDEFAHILEKLGFSKTAEVVKHREIYQCKNAIVTLDDLKGVGSFSEIEASFDLTEDEAVATIDKTAEKYGITGERLTKSYLEILLESQQ